MKRIPLFAVLPLITGCPDRAEPPPPAPADEREVAVCLRGEPFVGAGAIPIEAPEAGDAARIGALRWEAHEGCERFVIDLLDENGDPAGSAGRVEAAVLRELAVVRVELRGLRTVEPDATEREIGGELAHAAYAVWSPDGPWAFVDLHLAAEAEGHASVLSGPARVVVDLRPGGGPVPDPAPAQQRVVVLEPRPGEAAYPLTVAGYARTFEANVVARLEHGGVEVDERFTTSTAWVDAWGYYTITFEDGPRGPVTLHVGEYSARDGTWEGVAVELRMGGG